MEFTHRKYESSGAAGSLFQQYKGLDTDLHYSKNIFSLGYKFKV
jgi:hypothetical protein